MSKQLKYYGSSASFQAETTAFMTAIGITNDATIYNPATAFAITGAGYWTAIDNLVIVLKGIGWSKFLAVYPFIGGTASFHKWNLINPVDSDAAFRLTFSGTVTHSGAGMVGNGTTGFADTKLVPNATAVTNGSNHMSFYCRTSSTTGVNYDMGCGHDMLGTGIRQMTLILRRTSTLNGFDSGNSNTSRAEAFSINSQGYKLGSCTSTSLRTLYNNGSSVGSNATLDTTALPAFAAYIGAANNAGTTISFSNRQCALASLGLGLTSGEQSTLYTGVQAFQTALFRQV